jgi:hypothetical protein
LVCDLPLASLLAELVAGQGAGPVLDPVPSPRWTMVELLRLGNEGALILRYQQDQPPNRNVKGLILDIPLDLLLEKVGILIESS